MNTEGLKNRVWSTAEIDAVRKAGEAQAEGRELTDAEFDDVPRLTAEQLARMVRLREVWRMVR